MDIKTIQTFFESARSDPDLQKQLQAVPANPSAAETICAIAKSRGFDFSAAELRAAVGKASVLSDDELQQVSGGIIDADQRSFQTFAKVEATQGAWAHAMKVVI